MDYSGRVTQGRSSSVKYVGEELVPVLMEMQSFVGMQELEVNVDLDYYEIFVCSKIILIIYD